MKANQASKPKTQVRVRRGSGNVFVDLGFSAVDAGELQVKAELTRQIYTRIKAMGLTQIKAARRLGIGQPDVSKLMNARFTGYSTDRLIALLNALEVDVDIVVCPRKRTRRHRPGIVRVRESATVPA
ncbi:MAG TPA: helix-turn-helix transcriptional regulator [Tepidisphaeraceae bacterium]|jgi:predicted XRE-type DNA-binding protein|nr:helix-turn-helix transcriptional regulator [Tepidisphaeraceae bacterium]